MASEEEDEEGGGGGPWSPTVEEAFQDAVAESEDAKMYGKSK